MPAVRKAQSRGLLEQDRLFGVACALTLGVFLLFGAGFAPLEALHAAAHDGRHSFAFPCH